jgi:UTP-glucose-1-phosphate uridylyltransferase
MAAGNGSRYGALKQFDHLGPNKEYLFEFSIFDAINNGFDHIVIVTKKQFVIEIKDYLKKRIPENIKIDVIAQNIEDLPAAVNKDFDRVKPWGTAHAVWSARNHINNSFVVINADDFYGRDAFIKSCDFIKKNSIIKQYGMVPYLLNDTLSNHGTVSRGICEVENGFLKGIHERIKIIKKGNKVVDLQDNVHLSPNDLASMNFWIFESSVFNEIESEFIHFLSKEDSIENSEIYIPLVIQKIINLKINSIKLTEPSSSWFGVTYADDKSFAMQILKEMSINKIYPSPLWRN